MKTNPNQIDSSKIIPLNQRSALTFDEGGIIGAANEDVDTVAEHALNRSSNSELAEVPPYHDKIIKMSTLINQLKSKPEELKKDYRLKKKMLEL